MAKSSIKQSTCPHWKRRSHLSNSLTTKQTGTGTITGDRIQSQDTENILQWAGKLSPDGSTIQGKATCQMGGGGTGKGSFPFTMQRTQKTTAQQPTTHRLRPDFDDDQPTTTPEKTPAPQPQQSTNLTGQWVTFLGNPLQNYGSTDRITQTNNQFTLQSGISGQTFTGKLTGDRLETTIPRTSPGKLSPDRNIIRFSDMALVRLGSPTCQAIPTCKLP